MKKLLTKNIKHPFLSIFYFKISFYIKSFFRFNPIKGILK